MFNEGLDADTSHGHSVAIVTVGAAVLVSDVTETVRKALGVATAVSFDVEADVTGVAEEGIGYVYGAVG